MTKRRVRCAIYTRKSTEEGLDQEFNSLAAQREACEAFILSQRHGGWAKLRQRYDDGGISGATMDRPALTRLLNDVGAGRVDVIVVYKVDRLTRSLSDFARMVEVFDAHAVSFVSVTQQFNTTTSMGRLTLNVLLSFAQFEREVTAERIRDKIAASKKKGMWMGGVVPLGYQARDKRLILNRAEAATVRTLFELYLRHGNVARVKQEADRLGLRTKARNSGAGSVNGGGQFTRGHIYKILSNRLYVGDVVHRGSRYPGNHEAIVDQATWRAVQDRLAENSVRRRKPTNSDTGALLGGLLYDESGTRMTPTYTCKGDRRYAYYRSTGVAGSERCSRLAAAEVEAAIINDLCTLLRDGPRLRQLLQPHAVELQSFRGFLEAANELAGQIEGAGSSRRRSGLRELVRRIDLGSQSIRIHLGLGALLAADDRGQGSAREQSPGEEMHAPNVTLDVPIKFKRRGQQTKLVMTNGAGQTGRLDLALARSVARGHVYMVDLLEGRADSLKDLARLHDCDRADIGRMLRLAFLGPDIVEAIITGRQPASLTAMRLKRLSSLPTSWVEQRALLGFS